MSSMDELDRVGLKLDRGASVGMPAGRAATNRRFRPMIRADEQRGRTRPGLPKP
jgi:hypothetical protein